MTETVKNRHPAVAALLSLVLMGLGQLYNGRARRAAVFFAFEILGYVAAMTASPLAFSFQGLMGFYGVVAIILGIKVFSVVDAFVGARRIGEVALHPYNRWYVYAAIVLVAGTTQAVFESPVKSFYIPSGAMQPTLLVGDFVFTDTGAYDDRAPLRGDVVVFTAPTDSATTYVKRIVGLPGDEVQVAGGVLHINGRPVGRDRLGELRLASGRGTPRRALEYTETLPDGRAHRIWEISDREVLDNTPVHRVPAGHYFMMGDFRDRSRDSRMMGDIGFVPTANLVSRAELIYFSQNGSARWWQVWRWLGAIRFDRIGRGIE